MTKRTFDAIVYSSLMRSEVKAKAVATTKDATAKALSMILELDVTTLKDQIAVTYADGTSLPDIENEL